MNRTWTPYRAGLLRGLLEFRYFVTSAAEMTGALFPSLIALVVMIFLRDTDVDSSVVSLGAMTMPSLIGMNIAFGGLMNVLGILATEREDGTLLRAKAIPGGMTGYLVGVVVLTALSTVMTLLVMMVPALTLFDGVGLNGLGGTLTLLWVLTVGLVATMPMGAALGSLISSPRLVGLLMLPITGLIAVSGIFYPVTALPGWVQGIAQVFPFYWLGLGTRSAMLPDAMVAVEIGQSWRHLETLAVLGGWAVAGMLLAPLLLRRMARRESGSAVAARRERAMQSAVR
ncbi:ABC-2 type transport system permease protein [Stackebrandtia albiflava]|uniref:ABC-2 type transport system permease protein n=1 Tax=Stackebrandtia albiflava TaxID=406432 RepID=A0A562V1T6_9ACTN|nr:ABC transporter permease [Stackebrandtia albiflava]TWJ11772.1 ABC-2 type transport system permease protein [Stackebrandtia albiflava]